MKLIIGLGNPGKQYVHTRHNIGFRVLDTFAHKHHLSFSERKKFKGDVAEGSLEKKECVLLKPSTFMNLSGEAVQALLHWHKASMLDVLVVHDDLDIVFGSLKMREKGRSGGHNGIESIIMNLGSDLFYRLKVGIGRPPEHLDAAKFVLMPFSADEEKLLPDIIGNAVQRIEDFIRKR